MKIRKAVHAGYCWGVERALDIVTDTAAAHPGQTVRTLGPIIHNSHVVQSLEEKAYNP
jgi:4-hydroxy-3-methylbut-2-enyl diphosphate reductase